MRREDFELRYLREIFQIFFLEFAEILGKYRILDVRSVRSKGLTKNLIFHTFYHSPTSLTILYMVNVMYNLMIDYGDGCAIPG